MARFKITVADDQGHTVYEETIEAAGPLEACLKAASDAKTASVADPEWRVDGGTLPPYTMDS